MGPEHPEQPARVRAIADRLALTGLLDQLDCLTAFPATNEQLLRVHTRAYLDFLKSSVPLRGFFPLDEDTFLTPHTLPAARIAAGAVVLATDLVLQGKYRRVFCNIRPPGHHAHRAKAGGFCFFNNVAVGIHHALAHGVNRIALIDFDVHHGDGSEQILAGDDRVLMLSTFARDIFPNTEPSPLSTNMVNVGLAAGADGDSLRNVILRHWLPALEKFQPRMLFISAGFDAHFQDDMGNMRWVDEDYIRLTREIVSVARRHCVGQIISVLEGGYNLSALARCAALHVQGLLELV